jgi:hypothetical protein
MPGWGSDVKRKKTKADLRIEARREYGKRRPSDIEELVSLAADAKVKIQRLPPAPHPDDVAPCETEEPVVGPCQAHVKYCRAWRAAGRPRGKAVTPEPTERQKKLAATRAWNKARYQKMKAKKPVKPLTANPVKAKPVEAKPDKRRHVSEHPQAELRLYLIDDLPGPVR